jgi:hypothetical protein
MKIKHFPDAIKLGDVPEIMCKYFIPRLGILGTTF